MVKIRGNKKQGNEKLNVDVKEVAIKRANEIDVEFIEKIGWRWHKTREERLN